MWRKGLTGGYLPVAATLATDRVYDAFLGRYDEYRHFFHGHTYTGNALGCAAALATLGLLADGAIIGGVEQKARVLRDALAPLALHKHVGDIRQAGLMCGIELVADRETKAVVSSRRSHRLPHLSVAARSRHLPSPARRCHCADAAAFVDRRPNFGISPRQCTPPSWSVLVRDLLVTGTDTGVGKTVIAAALIVALRARGVRALGFKPAETGVEPGGTRLRAARARVRRARGRSRRHCCSSPNRLPRPSPQNGPERVLNADDVESRIESTPQRRLHAGDRGGGRRDGSPELERQWFPVPFYTVLDLAERCDLDAVVVARAGLGTLNHMALTVQLLRVATGRGPRHRLERPLRASRSRGIDKSVGPGAGCCRDFALSRSRTRIPITSSPRQPR